MKKSLLFGILISIILISGAGCVSKDNLKFKYQNIYSLNNKYEIVDGTKSETSAEIYFFPKDKKDFTGILYYFDNSNIENDIINQPDLTDTESTKVYTDISLKKCNIRIRPSNDLYPETVYLARCSDTESTVFIVVLSVEKDIAHNILKEIHSIITS